MSDRVCPFCQAQLQAGARFCPACGERADVTPQDDAVERICGSCGIGLREGARYCPACGKPVERDVQAVESKPSCAACGTPLRPASRYCLACGQPVGSMAAKRVRQPRTPAGRRRAGALVVTGFAAGVVGVAAGMWVLLLQDAPDDGSEGAVGAAVTESAVVVLEQPPDAGRNGLPMRPHVRLEHPDGAVADVPAAETVYGDIVDLRRVEVAPDSAWEAEGLGWEFVSYTGVPIQDVTTIDLPAGDDPSLRVIVRTALGLWVELPSEPVSLPPGKPGLRIRVSNIPAPWTLALARPRAGATQPSPEDQEDVRVEQLYWTDRAAWLRETEAWLPNALLQPVEGPLQVSRVALQESPTETYDRIRRSYRFTLRMLGAARAGVPLDPALAADVPIGPAALTANAVYAAGIQRLVVIRDQWLTFRAGYEPLEEQPPETAVPIYVMDAWIEGGMRDYAPWGLDLVAALLEDGTLSDFDLRVLVPYGEEKWADILLQPGQASPIDGILADELAAMASGLTPIVAGQERVDRVLRLYSTRAVDRLAIVDWLKENVDWIVRWLPVGLAATGLVPGAVGLSFAFAAADQVLNWAQDWYGADPANAFATMAFEGGSAGGLGGTSFILDMWDEKVLMATEGRPMLPSHGLTIAQFAYSVGMFAAVRGTDWYVFKSVRAIGAGTHAYCPEQGCRWLLSTVIPPVMFHAIVRGPLVEPEGAYPAAVQRLMVWKLEYANLDLHSTWKGGATGPRSSLADLPVNDYAQASWPTAVARTEPDVQAIRLAIPKSAIPPEAWGGRPRDADFSEFAPTISLAAPDGASATIAVQEHEPRPAAGDRPDTFYVNVFVFKRGVKQFQDEEIAQLRDGFRTGYGHQVEMSDGRPRRLLHGTITFEDSDIPPLEFDIDFRGAPLQVSRPFVIGGGGETLLADARRVQYATAEIGGSQPTAWQITSLTLTESGVFNEPAMYRTNLPKLRRVGANGQACRIEVATYEGEAPQLYLSCVFEAGCPGDDSCDAWPLAGKNRMSDELAGSLSITPTKVEGQACTLLVGEPLTCNMLFSISAELSQSGTLSGTFQVWSRYYRDGSEGTLTFTFMASAIR